MTSQLNGDSSCGCSLVQELDILVKFEIYTGKRTTATENGLSHDVVMHLMEGFFAQGYHLFCDNFYTSPALAKALIEKGCFITGTIRQNRVGFPKQLQNPLPKQASRGTSRWFRDGQLVFVKWKDTKEVSVLSTYYPATGTDTVVRRKKENGKFLQLEVNIPPPIKHYNVSMGSVDLSDQLLQSYAVLRKTRKWWKTLFLHFIDLATVNSYILYKSLGNKISHKEFRVKLARSLVAASELPSKPIPKAGRPRRNDIRSDHRPVPVTEEYLENKSAKATYGRKNCKLCYVLSDGKVQKKTPWKCAECNIPLCVMVDRNCFETWHTAVCYKFH